MPVDRMASVQGPVLPWLEQGSRVTTMVSQRSRGMPESSAEARALISAWGSPQHWWKPSPTTRPSLSTAAPTQGLGATW